MQGQWYDTYDSARKLCQDGFIKEAINRFRAILEVDPSAIEVHNALGIALFQSGSYAEAVACFESVTRLNSQFPRAWYNGGTALCILQRPEEGIDWLKKALALEPQFADAHYNIAKAYKKLGRLDAARVHLQSTLKIHPDNPDALNNLGTLMLKAGHLEEADECFTKALDSNPSFHEAAYNLAIVKHQSGRLSEALQMVKRALAIHQDFGDALALFVLLLKQACDWQRLTAANENLEALTQNQLTTGKCPSEAPFLSFTRSPDPGRNLCIARHWSQRLESTVDKQQHFHFSKGPKSDGRITVGYLSEQFRNAATSHLMAAMFGHHNRERFKIIAYSWGEDDGSAYRRRVERDVDRFVDIRKFSDEDAAHRISADRVDILVDLMGWMHGHRMGIAARRPAPIQVNYLGYPGTTGARCMDYIIADDIVIPPEQRQYYSEKVVSLPHTYQVTDPHPPCHAGSASRSNCDLPETGLVFCSFNTDYKIEAPLFGCWMDLLGNVPGSVLWLISRSRITRDNLMAAAQNKGVDPRRLVFAPPLPKDRHLARLKLADLALDTLTVNGHTTTSDALWAGVPVITVRGTHFASRVASSLLAAMGMQELVVQDLVSYHRLARSLALDPNRRNAIKAKLAMAIATQPLFDVAGFVKFLERAYAVMWDRYIQGHPPDAFKVEAV